jgi:putative heme iron utilization protein
MTGWQHVIQTYIDAHPGAQASDIAAALGCTEAEALGALSEAVWEIPGADLPQVLSEIFAWQRALVLVRNADAVAEVEVAAEGGRVSGEWLNWTEEGFNLHVHIASTHHVLALVRPGKRGLTYSFNLVNQAGQVFCRFYTRTPVARSHFLDFCQVYTPRKLREEVP